MSCTLRFEKTSCVDATVLLPDFLLDHVYVAICGGVGIRYIYNHVADYARVSNTVTKLSSKVTAQVAESSWQSFSRIFAIRAYGS